MKIILSPQRRDEALELRRIGDVLTINGEAFDFSTVPDGATIEAANVPCQWIAGPVERIDGELLLTLILPHGPNPSQAIAFPSPVVNPPDGLVALPVDPSQKDVDDVDA